MFAAWCLCLAVRLAILALLAVSYWQQISGLCYPLGENSRPTPTTSVSKTELLQHRSRPFNRCCFKSVVTRAETALWRATTMLTACNDWFCCSQHLAQFVNC